MILYIFLSVKKICLRFFIILDDFHNQLKSHDKHKIDFNVKCVPEYPRGEEREETLLVLTREFFLIFRDVMNQEIDFLSSLFYLAAASFNLTVPAS